MPRGFDLDEFMAQINERFGLDGDEVDTEDDGTDGEETEDLGTRG